MKFLRFLSLILLLTIFPEAIAFALPQACTTGLDDVFGRYTGFHYSQQAGAWTAEPNEALALREYAAAAARNVREFCFLLPSLARNDAGLLFPKLTVYYYNSSKKMAPISLCLLTNDMLYDFVVEAETEAFGAKTLEKATVYLDASTIDIAERLIQAGTFTVRLCGSYSYEYQFTPVMESKNDEPLATGSLSALEAFRSMLDMAGMEKYLLWDLNGAASGYDATQYSLTNLGVTELDEHYFPGTSRLISMGDKGENVSSLQAQLHNKGFTLFAPNGSYDEATRKAVMAAQQYFGFAQTGNVTPDFLDALLNDKLHRQSLYQPEATETLTFQSLDLALYRYWYAPMVATQSNIGIQSFRSLSNSDNCFLVIDGLITNTQSAEILLTSDLKATLLRGESLISNMTVLCESGGGTALDLKILPFGASRILLYCEVSKYLIKDSSLLTVGISSHDQQEFIKLTSEGI